MYRGKQSKKRKQFTVYSSLDVFIYIFIYLYSNFCSILFLFFEPPLFVFFLFPCKLAASEQMRMRCLAFQFPRLSFSSLSFPPPDMKTLVEDTGSNKRRGKRTNCVDAFPSWPRSGQKGHPAVDQTCDIQHVIVR